LVRLSYHAYTDWNARTPVDSASMLVEDFATDPAVDQDLIGSLAMRNGGLRSYVLQITARDLHRDAQSTLVMQVGRAGDGLRHYFLPVDPQNGVPLFDDHLPAGSQVRVRCEAFKGRTLFGARHAVEPGLPAPVFTSGGSPRPADTADSLFQVTVDPVEGTFDLDLRAPGIHHLQPEASNPEGYSLFVLTEAYPVVGTATDMLGPLRYITSRPEHERILGAPDMRKAIETFWLDAAGDRERAREAIRIYYARVENANRHFTSHAEGWRTDRGLVHIIFGTPNTIYRNERGETWIFGEENNLMNLTFTFVRQNGPYTNNDLVLQRDPMFKGAWYRNVESWRNGRVYQN
ncbi:MAG: GWxTD domain-containing protein, partial [Flavobacteriales bacterium]|nr:GWxTD domain-containing protein [Flavobacteriales bacterium]